MQNRIAIKITLIYFITSFLWILFSDKLIQSISSSADTITHFQTFKGLAFVGLTAFLLFLLIRKEIKRKSLIEADLISAKEKAEEASRLKSAFLANMSHEIRTPLNGIMGFSELLLDNSFTGEDKLVFAQHMAKNGNDLLKLINDIMDMSKIQEKQCTIRKTNFNLNLILQNIYNEFQQSELRLKRKAIVFKLIKDETAADIEVFSDPEKLTQVLQNLLNNAFFFTKKGLIHFGYHKLTSGIEFFVEDTGSGIDDSNKELIFKPFFKGKEHIVGNKGFGLGLAISKGLVNLLGGDLKFDSIPNEGSRFYFTIADKETNDTDRSQKTMKGKIVKARTINFDPSDIKMNQN
jgi:signal transduction histidine kinase